MTISQNTALSRIGQIAINAHDVDARRHSTATFWFAAFVPRRAAIVFRLRRSAADAGQTGKGGIRSCEFDSVFQVADIQATYKRLKAAGAKFEDTPHLLARMAKHDLWMTFFRDSEENLLALMSEVAHAA